MDEALSKIEEIFNKPEAELLKYSKKQLTDFYYTLYELLPRSGATKKDIINGVRTYIRTQARARAFAELIR